MNITTKHKSNASGRGQVIAKGGGKQRTISWDHSVSADRNHGAAAGTLALALGLSDSPDISGVVKPDGSHVFSIPVTG